MRNANNLASRLRISRKVVTLSGKTYELVLGEDILLEIDNVGTRTLALSCLNAVHLRLQEPMLNIITDLLHTHSEIYVITLILAIRSAQTHSSLLSTSPISLSDLSAYLESESPSSYQPYVRPALYRLLKIDPSCLDNELASFLEGGIKWEEQGGQYFRLMTNCPESGALTEQELHNLNGALNRAYAEKKISLYDFTLMWMAIGTGLRPIQIARMKRSDVVIHTGPEGKEVMLQAPLAKGEGKNDEYWLRRAPSVLAETLITFLDETQGSPDSALFVDKSSAVGDQIIKIGRSLETKSDRLKTKIPLTPYRLRYTLATRALAQGASDWEVARLLTHRSTSCIQYYRASMPELVNPIRSVIGKEMAYFARAFQGRLISDLSEATRKDEGEAEIMDFIHLTHPDTLGACGTRAACYQNAPIACLTCSRFEPYRDAPWEELLDSLIVDAERETEERIKLINLGAMSAIREIMAERDAEVTHG